MLGGVPPLISTNNHANNQEVDAVREGHCCPVRWKLLIITSLIAALVNAGGMRSLAYWTMGTGTTSGAAHPGVIARAAVIPLVITTLACIFVYRHTARRRKLQAALTALFALLTTFIAIFATRMFPAF
jgi:Ca2+/Na+ antiporter